MAQPASGTRSGSGALCRAQYAALVAQLEALPPLACPNLPALQRQHPGVPRRTLLGLLSQEAQYRVLKTHHLHKAHMTAYCARYLAGTDVLELCAAADFPPVLMLRRMLEHMLGLSKQRVSDVLKDPSLLDARAVEEVAAACSSASEGGSNSGGRSCDGDSDGAGQAAAGVALLARLRADIVRCQRADRAYSNFSDMAKNVAGLEHEAALYAALRAAGVAHWSEAELRERGMYKTPDALLQVPIAVRCPLSRRWHIVHWLDSKASFGDDRLHSQALEGQYRTYLNRYGSGAVIYWLGFVADLAGGEGGGGPEHGSGGGASGGVWQGSGGGGGSDGGEVLLLERFPPPEDIRLLPC